MTGGRRGNDVHGSKGGKVKVRVHSSEAAILDWLATLENPINALRVSTCNSRW